MPPETEVLEGELVPAVIEQSSGLFGTDDPELVVVKAADVSHALARVIRDRKLYVKISGGEHVLVGGWTLLGSMLGVFPITVWSRKLEDGWEARVEARTRDGSLVGAAESECLRSERKWAKADDYAIRSMAQTRATSKALRLTLGFVMELAGFDATPADEMPADQELRPHSSPAAPVAATPEQFAEIGRLIGRLTELRPDTDWRERAHDLAGAPARSLTVTTAKLLIEKLTESLRRAEEFRGE